MASPKVAPSVAVALETQPVWELWWALERIITTAEEVETGPITIADHRGHGRPLPPTCTCTRLARHRRRCGGGTERCERWWAAGQQRAARLVFENTKLHDDGMTLAELKIEAGKVALSLRRRIRQKGRGSAARRRSRCSGRRSMPMLRRRGRSCRRCRAT